MEADHRRALVESGGHQPGHRGLRGPTSPAESSSWARQNGMEMPQFKDALAAQNILQRYRRDSLKRQQLGLRHCRYKVKSARFEADEEVAGRPTPTCQGRRLEVRAREFFILAPEGLPRRPRAAARAKARRGAATKSRQASSFAKVARTSPERTNGREGGDMG